MRAKVVSSHLDRSAIVYVRQSTAMQVFEHAESTKRQYALVDRARALGWGPASIEVIDEDLGKSGATTVGRTGFARLAHAVAHGEVGAVLAVEVSRLARSSMDWQRLLELCSVAQVVVVDEQAIYDPNDKDDKLLLDIKGTMSEAELQWLGLRLVGARRNKARRGELRCGAPTGYVWCEGGLQMDTDESVQRAVKLVFDRYSIEPSAWAVVRWARQSGLQFPTRALKRGGGADVTWHPLGASRLNDMLHNPTYAGVYSYGRRPEKKVLRDGEICVARADGRDPEKWTVRIEGAHPGYITWETFIANQEKLRRNLARMNSLNRGAPREGAAFLAGVLLCGRCGRRMKTQYGSKSPRWSYLCGGNRDKGQALCWTTPGAPLDDAVETLFLETMVPSEIELSLAVGADVATKSDALDEHWRLRREQAEYEARRAERRYKAVDPDNRVVARTLEGEWEERLNEAEEVTRQHARARREKRVELTDEDRARIRALATDLRGVWRATTTTPAERKAMLRLVIEAISGTPMEVPRRVTRLRVQWKSGAVTDLETSRPSGRDRQRTPDAIVERLRALVAAGYDDREMAASLNGAGLTTGKGKKWNVPAVRWARRRNDITLPTAAHQERGVKAPDRRSDGRYSVRGVAHLFGVTIPVVRGWLTRGLIKGTREPYAGRRENIWIQIDDDTAADIRASTGREPSKRRSRGGRGAL